jgi:hypothetical protein
VPSIVTFPGNGDRLSAVCDHLVTSEGNSEVPAVSGDHTPGQPGDDPIAALERLDAALGPRDFVTVLTAGPGHRPFLTVTSRHAGVGDNIYADTRAYWWSWFELIGPASNPQAAAAEITRVLGIGPQPSHG